MPGILENMLSKLTGAYSNKPTSNIGKLFSIFAESIEDIESVMQKIDLWRETQNAEGTTLDKIGKNFGLMRNSASDTLYSSMIKVKLASMLSGGDVNTIINATSILFDIEAAHVNVVEIYPAEVQIIIDESELTQDKIDNASIIIPTILRVVAGGIKKSVVLQSE